LTEDDRAVSLGQEEEAEEGEETGEEGEETGYPAPAPVFTQEPADNRSDSWAHERCRSEHGHSETSLFGLEDVGDDPSGVGHGRSTERTGEETEDDDRSEVLRGADEAVEEGESDVGVDEEGTTAVDLGHGGPDEGTEDESEDKTGGDWRGRQGDSKLALIVLAQS
jgi:hypothetical protein